MGMEMDPASNTTNSARVLSVPIQKRSAFHRSIHGYLQLEKEMHSEPDITVFRPDRPGIRKVLGDLEAEIMELIWQRPVEQGTMVRDVFEVLYARRRIAYTTVMNTMARLAKKKLLRVETQEHAYIYYPLWTEQEFISRFVGHILEDLLISFSGATLEGFSTLQTPEAITQARAILDQITKLRIEEEK
jgi:predicted transcriptional regulator